MAILAAHPDDEMLGAAGQLADMRELWLIHLTDGVPSRRAARAHGFPGRAAYAAARRAELEAALRIARPGARPSQAVARFCLGLPDGRASWFLPGAAATLGVLLAALRPDILLSHAYEGGHPDHDAAAWIARAALRRGPYRCALWDMAGYHRAADGAVTRGAFLPGPDEDHLHLALGPEPAGRRAAALACFRSQRAVLRDFDRGAECVRPAAGTDFTAPPHPGRLHYETRLRALRGRHWRRLADLANEPAALDRPVAAALWSLWLAG